MPDQAFGPHDHSTPAGGSWHGVTLDSSAATPAGSPPDARECLAPVGAADFEVNGENAPAAVLSLCAMKDGSNGSGPMGTRHRRGPR